MGKDDKENAKEEDLPPLTSGMPPLSAVAYVTTMLPVSIPLLPSLAELDSMSQPSVWAKRKFPELLSLKGLALVRLGMAGIALGLTLYLALIAPGWDVHPNYKPQSKLRRTVIKLRGIGTMCPFTSWSWFLLGLGFLFRGTIALAVHAGESAAAVEEAAPEWAAAVLENQNILRLTLILWELSGPFAILVSTVIKYAIWPEAIKGGKPHNLAGFRNQLQHNLNSISVLAEATILGGPPVKFSHLSMAFLMGVVYISFTWTMAVVYFGNKKVGPQYIYWFFDTTLGKTATIAIVALTAALTFFFVVFSLVVTNILGGDESSLLLNLAFLVLGTHLVCKFKQ